MDEEYRALTATLRSFHAFHTWSYARTVTPKRTKYNSLSASDKQLLPFYPKLIQDMHSCVEINQQFTQGLARAAAADWGVPPDPARWAEPSESEFDKTRSTLLQLAREWSSDGAEERAHTFGRLVAKACELFPENRASARVLVPGCGLGRLVYEFVKRGFWTQGNEISYHMLVASGYMLNHVAQPHSHTVFPYIHRSSHVPRRVLQMRPVHVPDESAHSVFGNDDHENARVSERMSMAAGSFVDLYGPPGLAESEVYTHDEAAADFRRANGRSFDVVATCFFLDTAPNVLEYLHAIHHCLKDDGVWLNVGPLHWHFEGDQTQVVQRTGASDGVPEGAGAERLTVLEGMELARDELLQVMDQVGFDVDVEDSFDTSYSADARARSKFIYNCDFWVARKKSFSTSAA